MPLLLVERRRNCDLDQQDISNGEASLYKGKTSNETTCPYQVRNVSLHAMKQHKKAVRPQDDLLLRNSLANEESTNEQLRQYSVLKPQNDTNLALAPIVRKILELSKSVETALIIQ